MKRHPMDLDLILKQAAHSAKERKKLLASLQEAYDGAELCIIRLSDDPVEARKIELLSTNIHWIDGYIYVRQSSGQLVCRFNDLVILTRAAWESLWGDPVDWALGDW